ncbi:Thiol-disulfide interchange protein, contains DsbC and DsbD domains [Salinihabitans flavidus]|uniref:Thiol-disulfide interchange protein, contains DsbC and DsbD domains n=1 Tax=Salinihabitans flavidus TaxID=569882 RepID=A0A1H8S986_9RHOB|nr:protein-disulfide reductase DsbD domain-containing protein [Salinihabitans flavidus]SEO74723.1 Thiol-disulfide interchange protein, contains DsbC and DsbD domains [Salinihabitans flavidus]
MIRHLLLLLTLFAMPVAALSQSFDRVVQVEILPGWRNSDGSHMAALRFTLNPGWKTYWRAPGDAGIPPRFDWSGSSNLKGVEPIWPTPKVISQNGLRSIGYEQELILPLRLTPARAGAPISLDVEMDIGVCRDICVPSELTTRATLPRTGGTRDPRIAAALADRPYSEGEAGVRSATCTLRPTADGMHLSARIILPDTGGPEVAVIETADPRLWVAEPKTARQGDTLIAETELMHVDGEPFMLDRSGLRFTVIGGSRAVDIRGCTAG